MNTFSSTSHVLAQLSQASQQHVTEMVSRITDADQSADEERDSNCSFFNKFSENDKLAAIKSTCNFIVSEFHEFWMRLSDHVNEN